MSDRPIHLQPGGQPFKISEAFMQLNRDGDDSESLRDFIRRAVREEIREALVTSENKVVVSRADVEELITAVYTEWPPNNSEWHVADRLLEQLDSQESNASNT